MADYTTYTDAELEQAKRSIKSTILCHEMGNDFYYSSPDYKEDHAILHAIEDEINARKSVSELTDNIMKGWFNHA